MLLLPQKHVSSDSIFQQNSDRSLAKYQEGSGGFIGYLDVQMKDAALEPQTLRGQTHVGWQPPTGRFVIPIGLREPKFRGGGGG